MNKEQFNYIYDISRRGFLPELCVELPERYHIFNEILNLLYINDGLYFRNMVDDFAEYYNDDDSIKNIEDFSFDQVKTLYSKMSIINHKYIWGAGPKDVKTVIPHITGLLWFKASNILGIKMVLTHASLDLYNWKFLKEFDSENIKELNRINSDNIFDYLENIHCFSDHTNYKDSENKMISRKKSEQGFYLPMTLVEMAGGGILFSLFNAPTLMKESNVDALVEILDDLYHRIKLITKFTTMTNKTCNPHLFFNELRIYLGGFDKIELFPEGLLIDQFETVEPIRFNGGSAAQSSIIQVFDVFLSVEHSTRMTAFYHKTRDYMPIRHRKLIKDMENSNIPKIRDFILYNNNISLNDRILLKDKYNMCIQELIKFRAAHSQLIRNFIFRFIYGTNSAHATQGEKGTSGTNPQNVIDDTKIATENCKISMDTIFQNVENTSVLA
jgi:indoleamine 2,3-dioxygenase